MTRSQSGIVPPDARTARAARWSSLSLAGAAIVYALMTVPLLALGIDLMIRASGFGLTMATPDGERAVLEELRGWEEVLAGAQAFTANRAESGLTVPLLVAIVLGLTAVGVFQRFRPRFSGRDLTDKERALLPKRLPEIAEELGFGSVKRSRTATAAVGRTLYLDRQALVDGATYPDRFAFTLAHETTHARALDSVVRLLTVVALRFGGFALAVPFALLAFLLFVMVLPVPDPGVGRVFLYVAVIVASIGAAFMLYRSIMRLPRLIVAHQEAAADLAAARAGLRSPYDGQYRYTDRSGAPSPAERVATIAADGTGVTWHLLCVIGVLWALFNVAMVAMLPARDAQIVSIILVTLGLGPCQLAAARAGANIAVPFDRLHQTWRRACLNALLWGFIVLPLVVLALPLSFWGHAGIMPLDWPTVGLILPWPALVGTVLSLAVLASLTSRQTAQSTNPTPRPAPERYRTAPAHPQTESKRWNGIIGRRIYRGWSGVFFALLGLQLVVNAVDVAGWTSRSADLAILIVTAVGVAGAAYCAFAPWVSSADRKKTRRATRQQWANRAEALAIVPLIGLFALVRIGEGGVYLATGPWWLALLAALAMACFYLWRDTLAAKQLRKSPSDT